MTKLRHPLHIQAPFAEIHVPKGLHWEETQRRAAEAVKDLPKFDYSTLPPAPDRTPEQVVADMELRWFMRAAGL